LNQKHWRANQGSQDLDYSLVSNKNLSHKIPSCGWHPGPGSLSQNGLKPTPSRTKKPKSKTVVLKVGGIALLGVILRGNGVKKSKGVIGKQNNTRGRKCSTTNRSFIHFYTAHVIELTRERFVALGLPS